MAHVVFFRAVNVGGHQRFQPSVLAGKLAHLDVVNIGAAGTFVVREKQSEPQLRKQILELLPFTPELMICPAKDILVLEDAKWPREAIASGIQRYVSILAKAPGKTSKLPIQVPDGSNWQVSVSAVIGRYALSIRRPGGEKLVYPNEVIEKSLGIHATTRNWTTVTKIGDILRT